MKRNRWPAHVINGATVALGIALVQALLHAAAGPRAAALAVTGAIYASLADLPVRPERNWRRVGAGAVIGLAAAATMLLLRPHPAAVGIGIALIVFSAMMMLAWGPRAGPVSFAAVLSLVFTMGLPAGEPVPEVLAWQGAGAACYLLWSFTTSRWLQPRFRLLALAGAIDASADLLRSRTAMLRTRGVVDDDALRQWIASEARLAERLQSARDLLFAAAPSPDVQRQTAVLLRLIDLRDLLLASGLDFDRLGSDAVGARLRERCTERLQRLADALRQVEATLRGEAGALPALDEPALPDAAEFAAGDARLPLLPAIVRRLQRLAGEVERIDALLRGAQEAPLLTPAQLQQFVAPEGWPLRALRPHLSIASPVLRHALRAALALAAAYYIARALPWASHPQWLVLSVAVVLRNTFDQTVARRNLRVFGTVLGCFVVLALSHVPWTPALSLLFVVAVGFAHGFAVERYLVTAMAGTVMALLQAHLVAPGSGFPIAERVADTVFGAALAWAFSYVLPSWERRTLPTAIGRMLQALREYAQHVLAAGGATVEQRLARRRAYDTLGALSASVRRSAAEPAGVRPALAPLASLIDQAQRLMAHLSMVRLLLQRADAELDAAAVAQTLTDAAAAVDAALVAQAAPPAEFAPELPPASDASLRPWLYWRLRVTQHNAAEVGRAAGAALATLRRARAPSPP